MADPEKQATNTHDVLEAEKTKRIAPIAPYMWKKGQSGNPNGRPPGKTMKEYARDYLARMTDDERDAFFEGQSKTDT
jgi:hypothetical protein